jgi:hypothetical protein
MSKGKKPSTNVHGRLVRAGLRQLVRNARAQSVVARTEALMTSANPDERVMASTGSGQISLRKAPFERQTTTKGRVAYIQALKENFPGRTLPGESYPSLAPHITRKVAKKALDDMKGVKTSAIAVRKKVMAAGKAKKSDDPVSAMVAGLGVISESQRTGQTKFFRATLRRIAGDASFSGKDAFTDLGKEGEASFIQAAPGGKRRFREAIESDTLPAQSRKTVVDHMSDSSDEDDGETKLKNMKRRRVGDLTPTEQRRVYSTLVDTRTGAKARMASHSKKEREFIRHNFPEMENVKK